MPLVRAGRRDGLRQLATAAPFLTPWALGFVLFVAWPFFASLYWSFCRYDLLSSPQWVGDANYRRLAEEIASGERFGQALWNTAYYAALAVPLSIAVGVGLASMLAWRVPGQPVFRTLIFLPYVVPTVAAATLWLWLLDPHSGPLAALARSFGRVGPGWFSSFAEVASPWAWLHGYGGLGSKDALVLMTLWSCGNYVMIYLAALKDMPQETYEAAALDGAGPWRRFRAITLPLLTPVILFNLVMGLIQAVQTFTQVYLVSGGQGEPAGSTLLISLHLFLSAFRDLEMGYASAMAWVLLVTIAAATWLLFRWSRGWVYYRSAAQ